MTDAMVRTLVPFRPPLSPLPPEARPWQQRGPIQLLCFLGLLLPMAGIACWVYLTQDGGMTVGGMFLGPLLGGGTLIFWILFLHLVVCGDGLSILGFRWDRPGFDALLGTGLAVTQLAFHFAFEAVAPLLFPPRSPSPQILELISGVARSPWLLALWLGPVVWIGVAVFEELARAFLLRRLWLSWLRAAGRWGTIVIVSAVIGLVHSYQGPAAVVSVGCQSLLLGWVYLRTGRIYALIVSHALYDSVQIAFAVVMIRRLGL